MKTGGYISDEIIEEVREATDIVEVISEYISLKKTGDNYKGLCPFHVEKTPSFVVNPIKGIFHCFGCHIGGDVYSFLIRKEGIEFYDAVKLLAERAGINIPTFQRLGFSDKEVLYKIHETAVSFYSQLLWSKRGEEARKYLQEERGLSEESLYRFKLGYAPEGWKELYNFLVSQGFSVDKIIQSGLVVQKSANAPLYDRFRSRIIFPIFNELGRPVGFGGRILKDTDTTAKYINSPETILYNKSKILYGLHLAKDKIREAGAIIVEGYMDVIALAQAGFINVVAVSGTAFTTEHVKLIRRYTHKVWLVFDPDPAGIKATLRTIDMFMDDEIELKIVSLPQDLDPADVVYDRKDNKRFKMLLDDAEDYYIWRLQVALNEDDITTIAGKKRVLNNLLPFIRRIPNLVERQDLIRRTAEALDINEEIISYEVRKSKNKDNNPVEYLEVKNIGYTDIEKSILYSMITDETSGRKICNEISAEEFVTSECREIFNAITQVLTTQEQFSIQKVMNLLSQEAKDIVSSLVLQEEKYSGENIQNCINRLKERMRMVKLKELQQLIAEKEKAGEKKELYHLLRLYHDLIGKR